MKNGKIMTTRQKARGQAGSFATGATQSFKNKLQIQAKAWTSLVQMDGR